MTVSAHVSGQAPPEQGLPPDTLVAALQIVARGAGRLTSPEAIVRGLPLVGGRLNWTHLVEAGRQAGLSVRRVPTMAAEAFTPFVVPVIARRPDGAPLVVTRVRGDEVFVIDPVAGEAAGRWMARAELAGAIAGEAALVAAIEFYDGRTLDGAEPAAPDWFWQVVRANLPLYGAAIAASLLINLSGALAVFYVMAVYDRVIPNRALDTLAVITVGVLLLHMADASFKVIRARLIDTAARRFDMLAGARIFAAVLALPPTARPASVGTLSATIREFESLREFFAAATLTVIGDLPFMLMVLGVMAYIAGHVAWAPLIALPLMLALGLAVALYARRLTRAAHQESLTRQAMLHEFANGLDTLQLHGGEAWARRRWERMLAQSAETTERTRSAAHWGVQGIALLQAFATVAVVAAAAMLVSDGRLSTGALAACSILAGRALAPLAQLSSLVMRFQQARDAYRALDTLLAGARSEAAPGSRVHLPIIAGAVACRDLGFSYPAIGLVPPTPVLADVTVTLNPGEHVAIVGPIGSGKTTLLNLLAALVPPTSGHVLVDGVDSRLVEPTDLHAQIGYAPQFPMLFSGSIHENLTLGHPGASEAEVRAAMAIAGLDSLLATSAEGYGLAVGEGGRRLSGGTRQAVSLARAVLVAPPILLLDEPTSMMDTTAERAVVERLRVARQGKTTVIVTHRPALLALVDRILVLDQGRIVADGPRDTILAQLRQPPVQPPPP